MPSAAARILTLNSGSSSIKFALYEASGALRPLSSGSMERIGPDSCSLLLEQLAAQLAGATLHAVGHRIVHGGGEFTAPQLLTPPVLEKLAALAALDPQHQPQELLLVQAIAARFPGVPQVACFDTAFHRDLPAVARLLPIPRRYAAAGVRRYGFHGLSYEFLLSELARLEPPQVANGRLVLAHLGNGSSLAAVQHGRSIDTTMALTPAAGIPMGTRSGDLDPGLADYLARSEGMSAAGFADMSARQSGLLGVSGTSSDMRELLAREASDVRAREAVDLYCYRIRQQIGAYAATLGGLDALVFSGGIGEHAPQVRERACQGLEFLGIRLDSERNARNAPLVSAAAAPVPVRVIATDEQQVIARAVLRAIPPAAAPAG